MLSGALEPIKRDAEVSNRPAPDPYNDLWRAVGVVSVRNECNGDGGCVGPGRMAAKTMLQTSNATTATSSAGLALGSFGARLQKAGLSSRQIVSPTSEIRSHRQLEI